MGGIIYATVSADAALLHGAWHLSLPSAAALVAAHQTDIARGKGIQDTKHPLSRLHPDESYCWDVESANGASIGVIGVCAGSTVQGHSVAAPACCCNFTIAVFPWVEGNVPSLRGWRLYYLHHGEGVLWQVRSGSTPLLVLACSLWFCMLHTLQASAWCSAPTAAHLEVGSSQRTASI